MENTSSSHTEWAGASVGHQEGVGKRSSWVGRGLAPILGGRVVSGKSVGCEERAHCVLTLSS